MRIVCLAPHALHEGGTCMVPRSTTLSASAAHTSQRNTASLQHQQQQQRQEEAEWLERGRLAGNAETQPQSLPVCAPNRSRHSVTERVTPEVMPCSNPRPKALQALISRGRRSGRE